MGLAPPTGEHAEKMLAPNGWPESDEDINFDRAAQYMQVLRKVSDVADNCRHQQLEIFGSDVWSGSASGAANRQVGTLIEALASLQDGLATVITWHRNVGRSIIQAKSDIYDNVEVAETKIEALANEFRLSEAERTEAINAVVAATHEANAAVVTMTAEQILASKAWKPPSSALQDLLDQKAPPAAPGDDDPSDLNPALPGPVAPPVAGPMAPPPAGPAGPQPSLPGIPVGGQLPTPAIIPAVSATPAASVPGHPTQVGGPTTAGTVRRPASVPRDGGGDDPDGSALPDAQPYQAGPHDDSPRVAPASASVMPTVPGAAGGGGAGGSVAPGGGPGGGAVPAVGGQAGRVSPGQSSGVRPAAATHRRAPRGDRVAQSRDAAQVAEVAGIAAIPVSPARLERDAVAEAATADAARRRGADPLQLARRIAAALNAPVGDRPPDFGFFWVTGVTTEGAIVVANSYGLAYIPDGVQLPERVFMATADDAIPPAERARWATYPVVAVQSWAAQRDMTLRAVIATEGQLADSDPGVAKVVLNVDDIPDTGEMIGRSRLEVVNPEAAERLAQTPDARLRELLPPADANPPADERFMKWLQVMKPMVSNDPRRQAPHLQAFQAYVAHAQHVVRGDAYAAADPVVQRCAVADWLYWKNLAGLLDAALSPVS
ncbi:hypothetical protein [Mycobacterium sp. pR1184]|uniref:hypothetical protein n=1 Tax=Mycobacterium sp. pR1184 TaxID=3238981 RepID=UPI00351B2359